MGGRPLLLRELVEQISQALVRFTVLWVKTWDGIAEICVIELRIFVDLAGGFNWTEATPRSDSPDLVLPRL